jgi:hypothetical protein
MKRAVVYLHEDASESRLEDIPASADGLTYVGEADCPQCGGLGDQHTKYCPLSSETSEGRGAG